MVTPPASVTYARLLALVAEAGGVTVSPTPPADASEGDLWYDETNKLLKVYDGADWITTSDHVLVEVRNGSLVDILKGQPIYVVDTHNSGKPNIALADNDASHMPAIGLAYDNIDAGAEGYAIISGVLDKVNTLAYPAASALYVDSVAGQLTTSRPGLATEKVQKVGLVTRQHQQSGSILVIGAGRTNDITNELVALTGVTLGDTDLGTFLDYTNTSTGATYKSPITDNVDLKAGLQDISTAINKNDSDIVGILSLVTDLENVTAILYHGRYNTEASTQRAAGDVDPLTCEIYYTARPDGDGYAESEETATPPSGARIVRRLYYSDKFNADPTVGADWTAYTTQPADGTNFATAKAALLAGLSDTDATANTRGTLPVSLKMEYEAVVDRLLNDYPGAEAAYSVRLIDKNYSGYCMRVRNVNTNATADIGFDVDGNLDEGAIATLCGAYNGAVEIWYDQSGGGHHQVQETTTLQPFIYLGSAGAVLKENGKPVIVFTDGGQLQNVAHSTVTVNIMTPVRAGSSAYSGYTFSVVGPGGDYSTYSNFIIGTTSGGGTRFGFCTTTGTGSPESQFTATHTVNQTTQSSPTQASLYAAIDPQAVVTTAWVSTDYSNRWWYINYNYPFAGSLQVQEYVIYYSDKSSDQAAIETDINAYYQPTTRLLLDDYRNTAAAYSVRKLSQWYTGSCMRIREDSGDTETDIGFDSNGDLDTAAIKSFCDAAGTGVNGYVVTWYDQSGNGRDISQTGDTAKQPLIYNGTSVNTAGGKPALDSRSGAARLYSAAVTLSPTLTIMLVKQGSGGTFGSPVWGSVGSLMVVRDMTVSGGSYGLTTATVTGTPPTNAIYTMKYGSDSATRSNGSQVASTTGNSPSNMSRIVLGGRYEATEGLWTGQAQEFIIWDSDLYSTNAADLESNANTYFSIF